MLMRGFMFESKIFWMSFSICTGAVFLLALNMNRTYQSETEIIFLPKNAYVASSLDVVLSNAKQVASSAFFYKKLVEENQNIEDPVDQLTEYKRKEYWNNIMTIERLEKSSVLRMRIINEDQEQAELLASSTAKDIALAMSRHYDIRNDLDVRVIENVFTRSISTAWTWKWILGSVAGGFVLSVAIAWVLAQKRKENALRANSNSQSSKLWYSSVGQKVNDPTKSARKDSLEKEISHKKTVSPIIAIPQKDSVVGGKEVFFFGKKMSAPENLPVGSEFVLNKTAPTDNVSSENETGEKKTERILDHEATPEEVKKRLNRLLRGEM